MLFCLSTLGGSRFEAMDLERQKNNTSQSSSASSSDYTDAKSLDQTRKLFPLAIAVSMITLIVAGVCLARGMENVLSTRGPGSTMLSSTNHDKPSKSKLHRHLVKKEMDKKASAQKDSEAAPAKTQFKDFISSPLSLFIPFFTTYTTSIPTDDAKSFAPSTDDEWDPFVVALSNITVEPTSNETVTIIDIEDDDADASLFKQSPETNFIVSPDGKNYQVKADLPGLAKNDISAKTVNGMLYVTASKGDENDPAFFYISRSFQLPEDCNVEAISAVYNKGGTGALQLDIPKVSNSLAGVNTQLNKKNKKTKSAFNDDKVRKIEIQ